jgi:hypothetical protein
MSILLIVLLVFIVIVVIWFLFVDKNLVKYVKSKYPPFEMISYLSYSNVIINIPNITRMVASSAMFLDNNNNLLCKVFLRNGDAEAFLHIGIRCGDYSLKKAFNINAADIGAWKLITNDRKLKILFNDSEATKEMVGKILATSNAVKGA